MGHNQYRENQFLQSPGWSNSDGIESGAYVIHDADGQRRVLPMVYAEDVRDGFFFESLPVDSEHARVVWRGDNPKTRANGRAQLQLDLRTWTNPTPAVEITNIDFMSAMTAWAPFLIAMAVGAVSPEQVPASLRACLNIPWASCFRTKGPMARTSANSAEAAGSTC